MDVARHEEWLGQEQKCAPCLPFGATNSGYAVQVEYRYIKETLKYNAFYLSSLLYS